MSVDGDLLQDPKAVARPQTTKILQILEGNFPGGELAESPSRLPTMRESSIPLPARSLKRRGSERSLVPAFGELEPADQSGGPDHPLPPATPPPQEVARRKTSQYFESLGLPSIGLRSQVLERSKNDFYKDARLLGYPRIPGTSKYPLFVKPATSCGSQFIWKTSLCRNHEELMKSLAALNEALGPGRAEAGIPTEASPTALIVDGIQIPDDVVVQEYIAGWDYLVIIIEVGSSPVALAPQRYVYPAGFTPYEDFLTMEMEFHPDTRVELLQDKEDSMLYTKLQEVALQAFHANRMAGQNWCKVDIRVPQPGSGEPTVLEVNPMPAVFLPPPNDWEDLAIRKCFPGGHRAMINTLIASHMTSLRKDEPAQLRVADVYNTLSSKYDKMVHTQFQDIFQKVIARVDFSQGMVLELGSGTGAFGRFLAQNMQYTPPEPDYNPASNTQASPASGCKPNRSYTISGIELSEGMAEICQQTGVYDRIYRGALQAILPAIGPFDHIVSFSVLYFLSPEDFSMTMVQSFQLARKSLVVYIDEITDDYVSKLTERGYPHMAGHNHLDDMEQSFCNPVPAGWKLSDKLRQPGWVSPMTGTEIYVTVYFFERVVA
ncbi:hypothetical protein Dda_8221 [Drechslerella dactyloides]|uniref:ATP-grasp domain-containing protein n=1 Tax=Drechslerella dactyloides TaxID=74499 RepID=A0AAD6NGH9_DREDA|nr:hypothetical protein Dda_8221 [Drechslerella dactyloides]